MAKVPTTSSLHAVGRFLRYEWLWLGSISIVTTLGVLLSLYGADPRFHEVWQYTPAAIPTLAFVESIVQETPILVPSNHVTWLSVWVLQHVLVTPKWIVIIVYIVATVSTAVSAYVVFRARTVTIALAMLGAVAFALLPARFVQPMLAYHWWAAMPLVLWWSMRWWDHDTHPIEWSWVVVTSVMLALSGDTMWLWSNLVLLTSALIAYLMHHTWRTLAVAISIVVLSFGLMHLGYHLWPMPMKLSDAGIRLSGLWIPLADHRISLLGQLGRDFAALDVVHTDITYIGLLALLGLGSMVVYSLLRSVAEGAVTHVHRLLLVAGVLVVVANQRGLALAGQFLGLPAISSLLVDVWLALIGITAVLLIIQSRVVTWWLVGVLSVVIMIDHLPRTNIMDQMMQRPIEIPTNSWRNGVWFGQAQQAPDVVSLSGVGDIEPGFGRWSDADIADHVEVVLADSIDEPVTLEIRARGVGVNVGVPITIQIGDEQQSVILTETVVAYQRTFMRGSGNVIAIYPQPVTTPPPGDSRRIGVFVQSIRVVTP